jgi:hypothetical protein
MVKKSWRQIILNVKIYLMQLVFPYIMLYAMT